MKIITLDSVPFYQSESLNRGLWTFTSFISDANDFIFLREHLDRLIKGASYLFPQEDWNSKRASIELFVKNEFVPSHYFRLSIVEDALLFSKKPHLPKSHLVALGNAQAHKGKGILPEYLKNPNYLEAEMELLAAKKRGFNDVIFFDHQFNLTEASTSNVFVLIDQKTLLTPKVSSMVLAGVTRKKLIEYLAQNKFVVIEADISQSELESSLEIWLTNAVQGIRFVEQYENLNLFKEKTIYSDVCHKFGRFGEKFSNE